MITLAQRAERQRREDAFRLFDLGADFRAFLEALRKEAASAVPAVPAKAEPPPPPVPPAPKVVLESVRRQIAAIHSSAEASACADALDHTLSAAAGNEADAETRRILDEAAPALRQLAAEWQEHMLTLPLPGPGPRGRALPELDPLPKMAYRDQTAQLLAAPELLRAPLAETSLPAALRQIAIRAADEAQWKCALDLFQAADGATQSPSEQTAAIRAFLVGQQLELAELYGPAVASYEAVLQQVAEHIPVKESAARVKALRAEHPEALKNRQSGGAKSGADWQSARP